MQPRRSVRQRHKALADDEKYAVLKGATPAKPEEAPSPDAEVLLQMKQVSQAQIDRLQASLAAIEGAVLAEQMQLQRIEFAIAKAAREARYAEADRVARERRERAEGEDER